MEYPNSNNLAERTVKLVNKIKYTGNRYTVNLKSYEIGYGKKLGLGKNALELPLELIAYQLFLNIASLYVREDKGRGGKIIFRADVSATSYSINELQLLLRRFIESYMQKESEESNSEIIRRMRRGYERVIKAVKKTFPEQNYGLAEKIKQLEKEIMKSREGSY